MSLTRDEVKEELTSILTGLETIVQVTAEINSVLYHSHISQLEKRGLYSYNDEIKDLLHDQIDKIKDIVTYHI